MQSRTGIRIPLKWLLLRINRNSRLESSAIAWVCAVEMIQDSCIVPVPDKSPSVTRFAFIFWFVLVWDICGLRLLLDCPSNVSSIQFLQPSTLHKRAPALATTPECSIIMGKNSRRTRSFRIEERNWLLHWVVTTKTFKHSVGRSRGPYSVNIAQPTRASSLIGVFTYLHQLMDGTSILGCALVQLDRFFAIQLLMFPDTWILTLWTLVF